MTDQPAPVGGRQDVTPVVRQRFMETLERQEAKGIATYGVTLGTFNGRDAGRDAWEELVDLAQYVTQLELECADLRAEIARLSAEGRPADGG